jgi:hypothetical protein
MTAPDSRALARATDPATSHEAVPLVAVRAVQKAAILEILATVGPAADFQIESVYGVVRVSRGWPRTQGDSIRKRRSELLNEGKVEDNGTTHRNPSSGKHCTVWRVTA